MFSCLAETGDNAAVSSGCADACADPELYELAEGGRLAGAGTAGSSTPTTAAAPLQLQPGQSVALASLETVVCAIARYRPEVIRGLRESLLQRGSGSSLSVFGAAGAGEGIHCALRCWLAVHICCL